MEQAKKKAKMLEKKRQEVLKEKAKQEEEVEDKMVMEMVLRQKALTTKKHLKKMFPGIHVDSDLDEAKEDEHGEPSDDEKAEQEEEEEEEDGIPVMGTGEDLVVFLQNGGDVDELPELTLADMEAMKAKTQDKEDAEEECSDYDSGAESGEMPLTDEQIINQIMNPSSGMEGPIHGKRVPTSVFQNS